MNVILKKDSDNTLPKSLSSVFNKSYPFNSSGDGFSISRSEFSSGVYQFNIIDDAGTTVHTMHHGLLAGSVGRQTVTIADNANGNATFADVSSFAGGYTVGTYNNIAVTDEMRLNLKLWNDASGGGDQLFFTHTINKTPTRASGAASGVGVSVGPEYILFFDVETTTILFVMQTLISSSAGTSNLPYILPSAWQGCAVAPSLNDTFATVAMGDSPATSTVRTKNVYQLNVNPAGSPMTAVYWVNSSGYDGDSFKCGGSATDGWVEFYEDSVLVAMCQFGNVAAGVSFSQVVSYPKSFPTGEGANVKIVTTGDVATRMSANATSLNDANFTVTTYERNVLTASYSNYISWWFKEP